MADTVTVRITQGDLRGRCNKTRNGNPMNTFLCIPFARPPVNELRFQPPQPPENWTGTRDGLETAPFCVQIDFIKNSAAGQEDCLYLNVYTPQMPSNASSKKAVMFWIHGGGFNVGSGNPEYFSPDYLLDHDVVVVTTNYRIGIFGFLSLDNAKVPGNMGLKDQIAALKWVKENISAFGGDPNNITIFGESAGGASVHYLMLSPLSKGLFHKAIVMSGSALNPWAFTLTNKERAFKLGECLGCKTTDPDTLLDFLMKQDAKKLVEHNDKLYSPNENMTGMKFAFVPTVEPATVEGAFLTEHPLEASKQGHFAKTPLMIGCTSHEGIICLRGMKSGFWSEYDKQFQKNLPEKLLNCSAPLQTIEKEIREVYFGNDPINEDKISEFIDFQTDLLFTEGVNTIVKHTASYSNQPVYHYCFKFEGKLGFAKHLVKSNVRGACHGNDRSYLFRSGAWDVPVEDNSPDMKMSKKMSILWTNFAKYGNPTPATDQNIEVLWKTCTSSELYTMNIDTVLKLETMKDSKQMRYWEKLFKSNI